MYLFQMVIGQQSSSSSSSSNLTELQVVNLDTVAESLKSDWLIAEGVWMQQTQGHAQTDISIYWCLSSDSKFTFESNLHNKGHMCGWLWVIHTYISHRYLYTVHVCIGFITTSSEPIFMTIIFKVFFVVLSVNVPTQKLHTSQRDIYLSECSSVSKFVHKCVHLHITGSGNGQAEQKGNIWKCTFFFFNWNLFSLV